MRMNIFEIRKKNLSRLAQEIGGITLLAKQLKKSQSQMSQILMKNPTRKIGDKLATIIEKQFKKQRGWLDIASFRIEPQHLCIPLIKWEEVSTNGHVTTPFDGRKLITVQNDVSSKSFALEIVCDTMASDLAISFPKRSIIIVDPHKQPICNSFVVVQEGKSRAAIFRQLIIEGSKIYLKPLNSAYPTLELDKIPNVYGVACAVQFVINQECL